jgi:hypothetical protein
MVGKVSDEGGGCRRLRERGRKRKRQRQRQR